MTFSPTQADHFVLAFRNWLRRHVTASQSGNNSRCLLPYCPNPREGFLSKLENSASTSGNSADCDSLSGDLNNGNSESTHIGSEIPGISTTLDSGISDDGNRSQQEFVREVTQEDAPVLPNVGNEQEMYLENNSQEMPSDVEGFWQEVPLDVRSARSTEMAEEMPLETAEDLVQSGPHDMLLETEEINLFRPHESPVETDYITRSGSHGLPLHTDDINQSGPQVSVTATQERTWQEQTRVAPTESADGSEELIDRNWQEPSANRLFLEASENNATEQDQMQESHEDWPSHDLQEAIDSWLYMPSGERRIDTYFSDDDNVHSMEIRELFSRRRVSSLLRSSFRVSLDRVLQSHMERQGHASDDWEVDNASSSPSQVEQDQGQQDGDRALHPSGAADRMAFAPNEFDPTSSFITPSDPLWDEMQGSSLPHNLLSHHFGTDWEVVNELRIDIARLQQRLNNMQSMLEQCMDMQIELQRSVRQEVSAALNRSILTRDASKGTTIYDESQWECVRSGVCILCRASSIDSLLYRCGHMCTCSKCADQLIQDTGKCPMCRAPVVEAVRAYFIQ